MSTNRTAEALSNTVIVLHPEHGAREYTYASGVEALAQCNDWVRLALMFCKEGENHDVIFRGVVRRVVWCDGGAQALEVSFHVGDVDVWLNVPQGTPAEDWSERPRCECRCGGWQ